MKKIVLAVVAVCFLGVGCSNIEESNLVFDGDGTFIRGPLVSDGESIWFSINDSPDFYGPAEIIKLDTLTGDIEWRKQYGVGVSNDLFLGSSGLWAFSWNPAPPETIDSDEELFVLVNGVDGDIVNQKALPNIKHAPIQVGSSIWMLGVDPKVVYISDLGTLELTDTIQTTTMRSSEGTFVGNPSRMVLLGGVVWFSDGRVVIGIDSTTYEVVDYINPNDKGLDILEAHDGLLWLGKSDTPADGTFSYNPETGETISSDFYESPIGNIYHGSYTFDMIDSSTMAQIDTDTGEEVATFTDLDPLSVAVTEGFLWAHDGSQVVRYETKP